MSSLFAYELVTLLSSYECCVRYETLNVRDDFMKKLQILGTGCAKCTNLAAATEQAAKVLGLEYEMEKVTDLKRIMAFGVMMTPALVVDGEVKTAGRVPSVDDLKEMLA